MATEPEVLEPDVEQSDALIRHPGVPVSLDQLSARKGEALEILDARIAILETARKRAIRMTAPEDWILYKARDGRITGYLQDAGCDRIRDITGIEVFNVSEPKRIAGTDGASFLYIVTGCGRSKLTLQTVENMEGGRESTDDFAKDKKGAAQELAVRKAARANLDGNITRELAGLKSVPLEDLQAAWEGTPKKWEHCHQGRGFGSGDERHGATRQGEPDVEPPTCPHCQPPNTVKLAYRQGRGDRKAFYGCPNYAKHETKKIIVDAEKWIADRKAESAAAGEKPKAPAATEREPGQDD